MNQPHSHNHIPLKVSHYDVVDLLGRGGMGVVYLAKDSRLDRVVAIKCLHSDLFEPEFIARFKREALLLAKLNHPNIVQIYDFVESSEQLALVMELVDGDNLKKYLRENIVSLAQRLKWLVQISEGLTFAHEAGVIHRDLKPENILISRHNHAKISDLGIAKSCDVDGVRTDHIVGSYCAMSPEQASGLEVSFKSDLFSLGILAYQLLTGEHPFGQSSNKLQVMQRIISEPFTPLQHHNPDLPSEIIELIEQILDKNPDNRPDSTHWVATQFERLRHLSLNEDNLSADTLPLVAPAQSAESAMSEKKPATSASVLVCAKGTFIERCIFNVQELFSSRLAAVAGLCVFVVLAVSAYGGLHSLSTERTEASETQGASFVGSKSKTSAEFSVAEHLNKAFIALKLFVLPGKLDEAEENFRIVLLKAPNNSAAVAGLSLVYSHRYFGDSEDPIWRQKAMAGAQQAIALNNQLALAYTAKGYALSAIAEHEQSIAAFKRANQFDPSDFFARRGQIMALRQAQRYTEAEALVYDVLDQIPDERLIYDELGTIFISASRYAEAEQAFEHSIELQPDAVYSYASLYIAYERQNKDKAALKILQQGLQIRSSAWLHGNLGNALFIRQDYIGAANAFSAAVSPSKGNPGSYLAWANLADTLRWIPGREQDAINAYRKARDLLFPLLARQPNNALMISRMGLYLARLDETAAAREALDKALRVSPKDAAVHFRIGLAFEIMGVHEDAEEHIRRALELGFPRKLIEAEPDLLNLRRQTSNFNPS